MLTAVVLCAVLCLPSDYAQVVTMRQVVEEACRASQAEQFTSLASRLDDLARALAQPTSGVTAVSNRQQELSAQLDTVTARLDTLTTRLDAVTTRLDTANARLDTVTTRLDTGTARLDGAISGRPSDWAGPLDDIAEQYRGLAAQLEDVQRQVENISSRAADDAGPQRRRLGDQCESDEDCDGDIAYSVCRQPGGVCACGEDAAEDGERCRPFPRLSQPCRNDSECAHHTANATCADGVCACAAGFSSRQDGCRPLVQLGAACSCDADCAPSLSCSDGRCGERVCALMAGRRPYRLIGGTSSSASDCSAGRLLVTDSGHWWQLCDVGPWTTADAAVACQQFGFVSGTAVTDGRYGDGRSGRARVLTVSCTGNERHLGECDEKFVTNRGEGGCPDGAAPMVVECSGK